MTMLLSIADRDYMNAVHDDILIRQKDLILSIVTRAEIAKQNYFDFGSGGSNLVDEDGKLLETDYYLLLTQAHNMLLVVEEMWLACNYGYKTQEIKRRLSEI